MKRLFKVTIKQKSYSSVTESYYVVAETMDEASETVLSQHKEWSYIDGYIESVELIAENCKYGKPKILLFQKEAPELTRDS